MRMITTSNAAGEEASLFFVVKGLTPAEITNEMELVSIPGLAPGGNRSRGMNQVHTVVCSMYIICVFLV